MASLPLPTLAGEMEEKEEKEEKEENKEEDKIDTSEEKKEEEDILILQSGSSFDSYLDGHRNGTGGRTGNLTVQTMHPQYVQYLVQYLAGKTAGSGVPFGIQQLFIREKKEANKHTLYLRCCSGFCGRHNHDVNVLFSDEDKEHVIALIDFYLTSGWTVMASDFALKALIANWPTELWGDCPFKQIGTLQGNVRIDYARTSTVNCDFRQLGLAARMGKPDFDGKKQDEPLTGHFIVHAMDSTIDFAVLPKEDMTSCKSEVVVQTVMTGQVYQKQVPVDENPQLTAHTAAVIEKVMAGGTATPATSENEEWVDLGQLPEPSGPTSLPMRAISSVTSPPVPLLCRQKTTVAGYPGLAPVTEDAPVFIPPFSSAHPPFVPPFPPPVPPALTSVPPPPSPGMAPRPDQYVRRKVKLVNDVVKVTDHLVAAHETKTLMGHPAHCLVRITDRPGLLIVSSVHNSELTRVNADHDQVVEAIREYRGEAAARAHVHQVSSLGPAARAHTNEVAALELITSAGVASRATSGT